MKCLIARCHESKAVFAHAIPVKGDDEDHYVADLIASDVSFMGHIKLIIKTDNEPALRALASASLEKIRCQIGQEDSTVEKISTEQSAEYESASNGGTGCGIRAVRGLFRTVNLCTEKRIGQEVPATHPIAAWLLEHVCRILNTRMVGAEELWGSVATCTYVGCSKHAGGTLIAHDDVGLRMHGRGSCKAHVCQHHTDLAGSRSEQNAQWFDIPVL